MALIEIHGAPVGYSSSQTATARSTWIGHRVHRLARVTLYNPHREIDTPQYVVVLGREQVVWPVVTVCGQRITVILEPDYGYADARPCTKCDKAKTLTADALLVEIMPPLRRGQPPKPTAQQRRESAISAGMAF